MSEQLYHFQVVVLDAALLEALDEDVPALLLLLRGLLGVEGVAAEPQVPHYLVVEVQQVEQREHQHQDGEDHCDLVAQVDLSEEGEEGGGRQAGELQVVVAERVADAREVDGREEQAARRGVPAVQQEHAVHLYAEDRVRHHEGDVAGQQRVRHQPAHPAHAHQRQQVGGREEAREGGHLCEEDEHGEEGSDGEEDREEHALAGVVVGEVALGGALEVVHQLVQLAVVGRPLHDPLLHLLVQLGVRFLPQLRHRLLVLQAALELEGLLDERPYLPALTALRLPVALVGAFNHFPDAVDLLEDDQLLGLDGFGLAVAVVDDFLVVLAQEALLGEGDEPVAQQHRHQSQSEGVGDGRHQRRQLREGVLSHHKYHDEEDDGSDADRPEEQSVHDQRVLELLGEGELAGVLVLLREGEDEPAGEEVDVVDHLPGGLHAGQVAAAGQPGLVDVDGQDGEADQRAEDAEEGQQLRVERRPAVRVVDDQEAREQERGCELAPVGCLHFIITQPRNLKSSRPHSAHSQLLHV